MTVKRDLAGQQSNAAVAGANKPVREKLAKFFTFWLLLIALTFLSAAILIILNNIHFIRVLSNSMQPNFKRGDVLVVHPVKKSEIKVGDVVVLHIPNQGREQFAHRVIHITTHANQVNVETKGDANPTSDPWKLRIASTEVPVVIERIPASFIPFIQLTRTELIAIYFALCLMFVSLFIPLRRLLPKFKKKQGWQKTQAISGDFTGETPVGLNSKPKTNQTNQ